MDAADLAIRNATYRRFAELGRAPTADEVAAATGEGPTPSRTPGDGFTMPTRSSSTTTGGSEC